MLILKALLVCLLIMDEDPRDRSTQRINSNKKKIMLSHGPPPTLQSSVLCDDKKFPWGTGSQINHEKECPQNQALPSIIALYLYPKELTKQLDHKNKSKICCMWVISHRGETLWIQSSKMPLRIREAFREL